MKMRENDEDRVVFAARLKERRQEAGFYVKADVAQILNIRPSRYNNYEYAIRVPNFTTIKKLAELYHTDPAYLVGWTDNPNPRTTHTDTEKQA